MAFNFWDLRVNSLANEAVSASGGESDVWDTEGFTLSNLFLNIACRSGGTNTMSLAVHHSEASGSGFGAVPASALFNPITGEEDTFDDVTTAATDQTLALNRQQLKRYVKVVYTGTTLTQNIAVTGIGAAQMTEFS